MKINQKQIESESIGDLENIESSIARENLGIALKMVSKSLYSNPIGSFIREITSNAVDANVDAEESSPVMIHMYREDEDVYIEFKDKGVGMSPDTFKNIYMSWFNSDKRADNTKIGGWGLGSKSPLAYQDNFEITTTYNNIQYDYVLANSNDVPEAILLNEDATEESNGTTIRILINEEDIYKVSSELNNQLTYFNNVYVKNELRYYDNNFKIYEADLYKVRNNGTPFGNEMHIVLGQVAYPINFKTLGIDTVYIPVGLSFEVGDLEVTLSREDLNYTKDVKKKILDRIDIVKKELISKYEKQLIYTDLFDFIENSNTRERSPLYIKDVSISMQGINAEMVLNTGVGITLKKAQAKGIFELYNLQAVKSGKVFKNSVVGKYKIYNHPNKCYKVSDTPSYWDIKYLQNFTIIRRGKLTKARYKLLCRNLDLDFEANNTRNESGQYRVTKEGIKIGSAIKVYKIIKYVDNYINNNIQNLKGQADLNWVEEQKEAQRVKKEKSKDTITVYSPYYNKRRNLKLSELDNYKLVFYVNKDMAEKERRYCVSLYDKGNKVFLENTLFISISNTNISKVSKIDNVYHFSAIFKIKSFRNYLTKVSLYAKYTISKDISNISNYYADLYSNNIYPIKASLDLSVYDYFKDEIEKVAKINKNKYKQYEENLKKVHNFIKSCKLLLYAYNAPIEEVREYVKGLKLLHLNSKYYNNTLIDKLKEQERKKKEELEKEINSINSNLKILN